MTQLFSNNASTTLTASILISGVTINVADGSDFSSPTGTDYELLTIHDATYSVWEVVSLDTRAGNTLTVGRGVEGTQRAWAEDTYISANITAKSLQDLADQLDTTTSLAETANTSAGLALSQIAALSLESGGSPAVVLENRVSGTLTDGNVWDDEFVVMTLETKGIGDGFISSYSDSEFALALPNLGYTKDEWTRVAVWKNGVKQKLYHSSNLADVIDTSTAHDGLFQILGHRHIRFWPLLVNTDEISIMAPSAPWVTEGSTGLDYMDQYSATGVAFAYILGGYDSTLSSTIDDCYEYSWDTNLCKISTAAGTTSGNVRHGSGGTSDSAGLIYFFGGNTGRTIVERLDISPSVLSLVHVTMSLASMTYGDTFTDRAYSWICGFGNAVDDVDIGKWDMTLETAANITADLTGFNTKNISTFCDETYGSIFNAYDDVGIGTQGRFQKFTCATDTIDAPANIGVAISEYASALLFRSGSAFIWDGFPQSNIFEWSISTETVITTQSGMYNRSSSENHEVVCDGEHQAQALVAAMLFSTTGAVAVYRPRLRINNTTYSNKITDPVGSATDYYSAC